MQIKNFIGIDVSKQTLDFSVVIDGKQVLHETVCNESKSILRFIRNLMKQVQGNYSNSLFCMEHTGIYNSRLVKCLHQLGGLMWIESGIQIKLSQGATRGKNDKVDSFRIASYAFTNKHKIKLWSPRRAEVNKLAELIGLRSRLMKAKNALTVPLKEHKSFSDKAIYGLLKKSSLPAIEALCKQIEQVETFIKETVTQDEALCQIYKNICSVDGVGMITAVHIIVTTNEFIWIDNPRKYACYSGVAPFEHSSGTSIRGKNRVSHRANKKVKTILHLSAMSAINMKGELQDYFKRKVEEGKNKMSVLNAVRNKIIHRVFVCARENRLYEKKYHPSLV